MTAHPTSRSSDVSNCGRRSHCNPLNARANTSPSTFTPSTSSRSTPRLNTGPFVSAATMAVDRARYSDQASDNTTAGGCSRPTKSQRPNGNARNRTGPGTTDSNPKPMKRPVSVIVNANTHRSARLLACRLAQNGEWYDAIISTSELSEDTPPSIRSRWSIADADLI